MADTGEREIREPYGVNVGRLKADYPDFVICGDARDLTARTKTGKGSAGPVLRARDADGLAAKMDACRRRVDGV